MIKQLTGPALFSLLLFLSIVMRIEAAEITARSYQNPFTPEMVMDGNFQTRWSSEFSDDQWLEVSYDKPIEIVGLKIHWETAYGRDYDLELRKPDNQWITKNEIRYADGGVDELYFGPETIVGFKIRGKKRGTGWGYSIWEIETIGPEKKIHVEANSQAQGHPAELALDGQSDTYWQSDDPIKGPPVLTLLLPGQIQIGGLRIEWAQATSSPCVIEALSDGATWKTLMNKKAGLSSTEDLFFKSLAAEKIRFRFSTDLQNPVKISEIQLKGRIESWTPVRHYEMLAQRLPDGFFPGWLRHQQTFWTVTGLPGSYHESLLDEHGRVESGLRTFSVTPILVQNGRFLTAKDMKCTQSLMENWAPIPTVRWSGEALAMDITANTIDPDTTLVLYKLHNQSDETQAVSLLLAVRPLQINPPWQHGGFASIRRIQWKDSSLLTINKNDAIGVYPAPSTWALHQQSPLEDPVDITEVIMGQKSNESVIEAEDHILSAALRFDLRLRPGQAQSILAVYPNNESANIPIPDDPKTFFDAQIKSSLADWKRQVGHWAIDVPDRRIANLVRSNLAYLRINADGFAVQPGSRNYNSSWIRDGAVSATAMLRFGLEQPVRNYLNWFTGLIGEDGFVPFLVDTHTGRMVGFAGDWAEYDSFGQYVFLVRQAVEIMGDRELARVCWPKVRASLLHLKALRSRRLTDAYKNTEYEGILPESNSHEGYFPARHSYWDDFFALRGLQDAQALARRLGYEQDRPWLRDLEDSLRASVLASIEKVRSKHDLKGIPGCAELGDFDPTSTAVAVMIADERDTLPREALEATFDQYVEDCKKRAAMPLGTCPAYTPYEVRNISALIRLQRPAQARFLLDYFLEDAVRPAGWNHMAEVVHGDPLTASYIGDMPHTWVGAGLINAIRDMLVYEDRGGLVLAAAVSDEWIDAGVSVRNLQTWWGPISYDVKREAGGQAVLQLTYTQRPPNGFVVPKGIKLIERPRSGEALESRSK